MKPFTDTLAQLRYGTAAEELTEMMATLIAKCTETGKGGSITLKLSVSPGKSGQVEIVDSITTKLPEFSRSTSLFFVTPEGNLSRNDPRQGELPGVRAIEPREANAA